MNADRFKDKNRSRFSGSKFKVKLIYHENTCTIARMSFPRKRESREPRNFWIALKLYYVPRSSPKQVILWLSY